MIINIYHEEDAVTSNGSVNKDYTITSSVQWNISMVSLRSTEDFAELQLRWSTDSGVTWVNPFDPTEGDERILCLGADAATSESLQIPMGLTFSGGILRCTLKNYGAVTAEMGFILHGNEVSL